MGLPFGRIQRHFGTRAQSYCYDNNLYAISVEIADAATQNMLNWFVTEQVEEEESAQKLIDALTFIGDYGYGIYMFDKELAARTYTAPATTEE